MRGGGRMNSVPPWQIHKCKRFKKVFTTLIFIEQNILIYLKRKKSYENNNKEDFDNS